MTFLRVIQVTSFVGLVQYLQDAVNWACGIAALLKSALKCLTFTVINFI
jgi:hypothetical protein